jgi:hypothetical protein
MGGALGGSMEPQRRHGYNDSGSISGPPPQSQGYSITSSGPPQLSTLPFQTSNTPPPMLPQQQPTQFSFAQSPISFQPPASQLPPLKPVFGVGLEQLFERDGSAVPMVVYQCIQAVDLFGLEVEGIYRLSGTASHVNKLKAMFDNGISTLSSRRV